MAAPNGRYRPRGPRINYVPMMPPQQQRLIQSHAPLAGAIPSAIPAHQQLYMQQQQQQVHYTNNPSFPHYQQQFQLRQQQYAAAAAAAAAHHHYAPQPQQILPMNTPAAANTGMPPTMMPDNSALLGTTPHLNYLAANPSAVLQQQQPQQQHHASMMSSAGMLTAAKQSKAIKIVNPETMKEVDTSNLKKTSPASSARSTPKPNTESEQVQQKFKQNVNRAAVDSKGNNEVAKQPAVTPNAIITQPNQDEHQSVTMVTTDPVENKPESQDTVQSSEVISELPSNSGVHQKESVSEPSAGKEQLAEISSSGGESLLPQQQQLPKQLEDNSSSSISNGITEVSETMAVEQQPVNTAKVIEEFDEQIVEIQEVVNKPEPVTMETLNAEPDEGSDSEKPDVEYQPTGEANMEKQDVEASDIEKPSAVQNVKESDADMVVYGTQLEDTASMETFNMEKTSIEKPSAEKPAHVMEIPGLEERSTEECSMEEATTVDESSVEQGDSDIKKDASTEDKSTEEDVSISATIEMDSFETGERSCMGGSTGPSSLEGMDRIQETTAVPMATQLRCDEMVSDEEATEDIVEVNIATAAGAVTNGDSDDNKPQHVYDEKNELAEEGEEEEGEGEEEEEEDLEEGELEEGEEGEEELEDGRQKRYDRGFLLSLQFLEQCKQRPANLMNAEYIRKEPRQSDMRFDSGYHDNFGGGGGRKKGMSYPGRQKKIELPSKGEVELRKAEKRWVRPSELEAQLVQAEKETQTQELFRKFVGILNKLTPQKFETLANQALQMPINSEDRLKGCIDRIFIKALEEPNFSVAYAQLCRVLSKVSVEVGTGPDVKKKTFRSLLLTKCQQEFEKDKESDKVIAELKKKVDEAAPEEKKQLEEELSEKEYRSRHNYLGNIRFIGELFKIKMLSEGIMHECIRRLLQSTTDEEALECFAKLMFTIGKDLDHEKGQALIKQYMDRVQLIINAGKISSRIKFFLQDVIELRNANWVPRRENNNPKKIDQIHEEAKQEEAEKMRELAAHPGHPMGGRQISKGSLDMDSRKRSVKDGSSKMAGDWSSGSDKDKKPLSSQPKLDSTKFRNIGKQPGTQLSFAPIGKLSMRPGGASPVTMDKSSRQEPKGKPSRSSGSGSKRSDSRSGSISAGASGPMMSSGQSRRNFAAPDKHRERQQALELASNISGSSRPSSSSSSSKGGENKPVSVLKRPTPDVLSEEEVEKKSSSLIAEFCQNVDYEAAIEEVRDMKSPGKHHRLVCQIVNDVLEKPAVARSNAGKLFHQLIRKNVISKEKFTDGFTEVLEVAEDIEIDVPKIWLYLAEIVVPVIEDGTVSLDVLTKAPASIMESGKGAQLLAEVLKLSEKIMGSGQVTVLWTNSTVTYSTFKILNVEEFKKKYGLQFLPSSVVVHGVDIKRLMELLRSRDNTNTEIMNCIEKEHPESRERSLIFIRDLGMALFKTVIDGSGSNAKYNEELFDSRITIVTKYIEPQNDSNHQRQLEFLYALQMVLHELEQPAGVATIICKKLSETGIFEDAAFHLWKTSGSETIGHGTTMLALKDFYDWLESTPVESDYSQ